MKMIEAQVKGETNEHTVKDLAAVFKSVDSQAVLLRRAKEEDSKWAPGCCASPPAARRLVRGPIEGDDDEASTPLNEATVMAIDPTAHALEEENVAIGGVDPRVQAAAPRRGVGRPRGTSSGCTFTSSSSARHQQCAARPPLHVRNTAMAH
jgi:hypothetical protein